MDKTLGYISWDTHLMAIKALSLPGPVPSAGNAQFPGKSILIVQMTHPSWQSAPIFPEHLWCPTLPGGDPGTPGLGIFGLSDIRFLVQSPAQPFTGCGLRQDS